LAPTCPIARPPPPPPPPPPLEAYAYALWIVAGAALLLVACLLLWLLVLRRRLHGKILEPRESPAPLASLSAAALLAKAAIPNIDEQIVNIGKKEDYFQCKLDSELGNAMKFHAAGKKREALQCLKRKKMYEQRLTTLDMSKMNLENLKSTIMSLNDYLMANDVLIKTIGGVDKVEELMDGLVEVHTDAREIDNAMNRQLGGIDADDDELLAEYAKLDRLMEEKRAADLSKVDLPRGHTTRSRSA